MANTWTTTWSLNSVFKGSGTDLVTTMTSKYFQKSALRYQLWPSFSGLIFNENASFLEFEFRLRVHFK